MEPNQHARNERCLQPPVRKSPPLNVRDGQRSGLTKRPRILRIERRHAIRACLFCAFSSFVAERFLVLLIWLALRRRGLTIGSLVSGRWETLGGFLKDLGLAVGFVVAIIAIEQGLSVLLHANSDTGLERIMPTTALELAVYLIAAATGGFCEELIFRGYLMQQFSAWTGSSAAGLISQGILFGLGHAYYGWKLMLIIMLHGSLLGLLTYWRKSLRPAMLAHGLQNVLGGVVAFISGV